MAPSDTPNQPDENPFEVSGGLQSEDTQGGSSQASLTEDSRLQMPPVEASYWTGVIVSGLMIFVFCGIASFSLGPADVGPWALLIVMFSFGMGLLCFALPLSLIRLWMHRWSIARAIGEERYPGGQRFGLGYLIYSLVLSTLSFLGGGMLFFGICTAVSLVTESFLNPIVEFTFFPLLIVDGIISFLATLHLLRLGVPKYR